MNDDTVTTETTSVSEIENAPAASDNGAADYGQENVQIFRDTAHIRQRPSMYIGNTSSSGLHHLVFELVYNSVDEALAGYCKNIHVKINKADSSITVADDGRGIPVEEHHEAKRPTLEVVMTTVGAGAKFDHNTYKVSAGLHGIGAKAVTALSEWVEAEVRRDGKTYVQEYERGKPITPVRERGAATRTGTKITFKPDREIFHDAKFDYDTLENRLRELAFLNKGLAIKLTDERTGKEELFKYDGGIAEFVEYLNRTEDTLHKPIYIEKTVDNVHVEVALQYTTSDEERVRCYANNAYNSAGGTHLSGFRTALTRTLNHYGDKENLFKNDLKPIGEDFREGLTAVVSVQVPNPQLEAQTKVRLNNPEVEGIVAQVVHEGLSIYLEENPKDAHKIMKKVILAAEAREAAAKAKKALKERKNILNSGGLPGKLMDCTSRDRDSSELFLVEGDSAGGSAESGRDRMFQAILPLRGKPLNVEKAKVEKVLGNDEICSIISAVGIDIGENDDISNRRYDKIVLLTDADVDGQHIRTLLLTFFYRQMRKLVEEGHIFVARPPLFKVAQKNKVRYVQTAEEMHEELMRRGLEGTSLLLRRFDPEPLKRGEAVQTSEETISGDRLAHLMKILDRIEEALQTTERRGLNLPLLFGQVNDEGKLPAYRVLFTGKEFWFHTEEQVDEFRRKELERLGKDLVVADEDETSSDSNNSKDETEFTIQELHEVREIHSGLEKLREFNLGLNDLIPLPRVAGREPPDRFILQNGDVRRPLADLRLLNPEVRKLGERGLTVTRFKGLGEMDPEELWETTLDPSRRTLLKVNLDDALKADEMFRTLMGDKVEPRRDFIQKHALEVKDIDYHGA
ncbi:MAG: DNA topoisomerase (ATP-hydrolyzing) [Gemmatales bacterium]|nr:MAG: DNA topoisomerase (ATP-hydrolyzing) [Gemmatales bacterium]